MMALYPTLVVGSRCSHWAASALLDLLHFVIRKEVVKVILGYGYGQDFYHQMLGLVSLSRQVNDGEIRANILPRPTPTIRIVRILGFSRAHVPNLS